MSFAEGKTKRTAAVYFFYCQEMRKSYEQHQNRTKKSAVGSHHSFCHGGVTAQAEELPIYSFDEVVVTATRTENDVKKVPASTQVITQEDIKRNGATSVRGALATNANIFQKDRWQGGGHDVIIRGMDTDKSLIMVNGHRVANEADISGLGNAMGLDRININNVEKIEVVKGPSSALYGSEAMGGVINIITKDSKEMEIRTGLVQSSVDFNHWWHLDSGRIGKFAATLDMQFNKNRRNTTEGSTWSDYYGTAQTYNFRANYKFNDKQQLSFFADHFTQNQVNDAVAQRKMMPVMKEKEGMPPTVIMGMYMTNGGDGGAHYKQQTYGLSWDGKTAKNNWQIQAYRSKFDWQDWSNTRLTTVIPMTRDDKEKEYYSSYIKEMCKPDFNKNSNTMFVIEGKDSVQLNDKNRLTFGAEYIKNEVKGTNIGGNVIGQETKNGTTKNIGKKEITTYAGYLQDEIQLGKWFIIPAIRYDHHEDFGSHVSPKFGVTYEASDTFRVKANYGKGFKAPTVAQLYYDLDRQMGPSWNHIIGNADLKPEESTSWDLGFETEFGKGYTTLSYFDSDVTNLISSDKIGIDKNMHNLYKIKNISKARIKGVENTLGYRFNDVLDFKVNSTWLDAKDTTMHTDLTQRAKLTQIYALTYDDHKDVGWSAILWDELNYDYVVPQKNSTKTPLKKKSYNLLNFTLTRKVNKDTRVYGSVQNIFDKTDVDCDLDGRYWLLGWEHKF